MIFQKDSVDMENIMTQLLIKSKDYPDGEWIDEDKINDMKEYRIIDTRRWKKHVMIQNNRRIVNVETMSCLVK